MKDRQRNIAIDVMKFIAALLITNSHFGPLYVHASNLATGGAIGDAIFFFCSGFTLFLGQERRFDNWYKRRISRIYPTVLMWGFITAFLINPSYTVRDSILSGGGWFVSCIMVYYVILYFVWKFFRNHLWITMLGAAVVTVVFYYLTDSHTLRNFYGDGSFRLVFFFLIMLLGAIIGRKYQSIKIRFEWFWLVLFIIVFYAMLVFKDHCNENISSFLNLMTIPCLGVICIVLYSFCNSGIVVRIMGSKFGDIIRFIGGLCLEIYVVQHSIITTKLNSVFPFNLLLVFTAIILTAYVLKCLSRLFLQTFNKSDFNWREITSPLDY